MNKPQNYELMLKNDKVLSFSLESGECVVLNEKKLPFSLKGALMDEDTFQAKLFNISALKEWCAKRTLSMSKQQAKKICNALLIQQDDSVETKSRLALMYKCMTLDDSYWVKKADDNIRWEEANLFANKSENLLTPVSLKGEVGTLFNGKLKNGSDLGVDGTFAKSWIRENNTMFLLKADDAPHSSECINEVCASMVLDCFKISHANYELSDYEGLRVSKTRIFTSENLGLLKYRDYKKCLLREGRNAIEAIKESPFADDYYRMCIFTYLLGNEDLHDGNWGFLQSGETGEIVSFAPLYDFNYAFGKDYTNGRSGEYGFIPESRYIDENGETIFDSARLEDEFYEIVFEKTIKEAALNAMERVCIEQVHAISEEMFPGEECYREFVERAASISFSLKIKEKEPCSFPEEEKDPLER